MKRLFILIAYSLVWLFIGYVIANIGTIEAQNQRDRLADYIHQYMDTQYECSINPNYKALPLEEAIKAYEEEDNSYGNLGFYMNSDSWAFAY